MDYKLQKLGGQCTNLGCRQDTHELTKWGLRRVLKLQNEHGRILHT